jgi:hypothetical protein
MNVLSVRVLIGMCIHMLLYTGAHASDNSSYEIKKRIDKINEQEKVFTPKWRSEFLIDYKKIISETPNPESMARELMKNNFNVNPDETHFVIFNSRLSFDRADIYDGGSISDVMTLTQAALLNGPTKAGNSYLDYNAYSSVYHDFKPGQKGYGFGDRGILDALYNVIWYADIQTKFKNEIDTYWTGHYQRYIDISRKAFSLWAYDSYRNLIISNKAYELVESVIANDNKANVFKFDIYGYYSNSILWIESPDGVTGLLYVPGSPQPFHEFDNVASMRSFIASELKSKEERVSLSHHFSLYDRQNGATYSGVDWVLKGIGDDNWTTWDSSYILYKKSRVTTDAFVELANATKAREISDGDTLIKSNAEARTELALRGISTALNFFPILDLIAPEIGIPIEIALNATTLGLNIDLAIEGDKKEDRDSAISGIASSSIFIASSAIIPPAVEHVTNFDSAISRVVKSESLDVNHLRGARGIPLEHELIGLSDVHDFIHPVTKKPSKVVRLSDEYRLATIVEDEPGVFKEINFKSGKIYENRKIVRNSNGWSNEIKPICPHI